MHKKSKITFHFANGEEYEMNGYRHLLLEALRGREDYITAKSEIYIMKNHINYIKIEEIEDKESEGK